MNKPYSRNRNAKFQQIISGMLISMAISLGGCATTGVTEQQVTANKTDPYQNFNRKMFIFNDTVDDYVAAPISDAYTWITPQFMQTGVFNFFSNLKNINVVINDVLQAKFAQGAHDTGRFALNTTMGLAGFVDVATHVGLERNDEDFDQTLAVWGVPQGSYLVIPFLGPTTMRGIPGAAFDTAANPASYVGMPVQLISLLNTRANAEGSLKFIDEAALDPYVFTRESFLQWRTNLATDGKSESSLDLDAEWGEDAAGSAAKGSDAAMGNKKAPALHVNTETK
jgi:phospholipid-binding lipoprotein MlaA